MLSIDKISLLYSLLLKKAYRYRLYEFNNGHLQFKKDRKLLKIIRIEIDSARTVLLFIMTTTLI